MNEKKYNIFRNSLNFHRSLVKKYLGYLFELGFLSDGEYRSRALDHDLTKVTGPFYDIFVEREYIETTGDGNLEDLEPFLTQAFEYHSSNERHHLEFYNSVEDIKKEDLCEMIADWFATSKELGKDPLKWINENIYDMGFTDEQINFIKKTADILYKKYWNRDKNRR